MKYLDNKPYYSLNEYLRTLYGEKVYKLALNANLTCPNRDGTLDHRGCIFCSSGGSSEFASDSNLSISSQIKQAKKLISNKKTGNKYIAYFQAFTNTYGDLDYLRKIYYEAINNKDIVGISIATRPDCINNDVLKLLCEINCKKKVWIELGLQTIHESSALFIRRGYKLDCFDEAVNKLNSINIDIVVHLIIGLPNETKDDILQSINYISQKPIQGIKLQLLHILKNTDLAKFYIKTDFKILSLDEYVDIIIDCIEVLPPHIVVHRVTGDGPKDLLIAPLWSKNKRKVLNTIHKRFKERETFQGKYY